MKILLIEDEKITRITLTDTLEKEHYQVTACATGSEGLQALRSNGFDVVITDLRLPRMNGLDILQKIKQSDYTCPVIIITAYATVETAIRALKLGAYDYLTKPFSPDELLAILERIKQFKLVVDENTRLKQRLRSFEKRELIGQSPVMRALIDRLNLVAQNDSTVLIQGESGSGKEVVARYLHRHGNRREQPFVAINCAALPESLLESELFGYEKGAFTGATRQHKGYIERANGGILFIDDIDDMPPALQVKLLRFLQEREIQRIGGNELIPIDVRIIAATKVDLRQLISTGKFREDLYYRLNIIPLTIPPLRERKQDIPLLIEHFIEKHAGKSEDFPLSQADMHILMEYNWPGNVRELENVVQRMIAIPDKNFFLEQLKVSAQTRDTGPAPDTLEDFPGLQQHLEQQEKRLIRQALEQAGYNITRAARLLKIPRTTLRSKMEKMKLLPGWDKSAPSR